MSCEAAKPCSCTVPPEFSSRSSTWSPGFATRSTAETSSRSEAAALARRSPLKSSTKRRGFDAAFLRARLVLALALLVPRLHRFLVAPLALDGELEPVGRVLEPAIQVLDDEPFGMAAAARRRDRATTMTTSTRTKVASCARNRPYAARNSLTQAESPTLFFSNTRSAR